MALHNFIRESAIADADFDKFDSDDNYLRLSESSVGGSNNNLEDEDRDMNAFRDSIADGLSAM